MTMTMTMIMVPVVSVFCVILHSQLTIDSDSDILFDITHGNL